MFFVLYCIVLRTINNVIGKGQKQSSYSKFKDECDNVFTNPQDISNKFNEFFVNIGLASNTHKPVKIITIILRMLIQVACTLNLLWKWIS